MNDLFTLEALQLRVCNGINYLLVVTIGRPCKILVFLPNPRNVKERSVVPLTEVAITDTDLARLQIVISSPEIPEPVFYYFRLTRRPQSHIPLPPTSILSTVFSCGPNMPLVWWNGTSIWVTRRCTTCH